MTIAGTTKDAPTKAIEAKLRDLFDSIRPKPGELRWQEIPWQTDIRAACQIAAERGRPIFLWAMNGNPLGCT